MGSISFSFWLQSYTISSKRSKTEMCDVCGKFMRSYWKICFQKHQTAKHGKIKQHHYDPINFQHKEYSKKIQEQRVTRSMSYGANLKIRSIVTKQCVYQKNVKILVQIYILSKSHNISEKLLSKQNKFCLDLFWAL